MKNLPTLTGSIALVVALTGCVVSIGDGSHSRDEVRKPPAPVVVMPSNAEDTAVIAEIDAAGKLSFEAGKLSALRNVAQRSTLTPSAQVHLVNTSLRVLDFEASRVDVLLTLVANPAFTPAAKEAILRQLERLEFEASKNQVLGAIQERTGSSS
jgi:hypothetical protein